MEVIIACPNKLFYNVSIPCCLWFLAKDKGKRKNKTLFINATDAKNYKEVSRKNVKFTHEHIQKIADTVSGWRDGKNYTDTPGFCYSATTKEIQENGCTLTPGRYVGSEEAVETVSSEKRIPELEEDLRESFRQEPLSTEVTRKELKKVGIKV